MAQDPPEPAAEQAGLPGPGDPATLWDDFAPPLRAFLARRVPAESSPMISFRTYSSGSSSTWIACVRRSGLRRGSFRLREMHSGTRCVHASARMAGRIRWTSMCRQRRIRPLCATLRRSSRHA